MTMPTTDQLAEALAKTVETLRGPVTDAERASYHSNKVKFNALADELGVTISELQAAFAYELFRITGNTALPSIPTDRARRMQ